MNENKAEHEQIPVGRIVVEVTDHISEHDWKTIEDLEKDIFSWSTSEADLATTRELANSDYSVNVLARDLNNEVVGYLIAHSAANADEELRTEDSAMSVESTTLYVVTFALSPESRSRETLKMMFEGLVAQASAKGFKKISAHSPVAHARAYKRLLGAKTLHVVENWFDSNEDHVYWEFDLDTN